MAAKKKAPKLKFEVSRSAVGGIAVVLFCLFVWSFIFGVWAGQSMLPGERVAAQAGAKRSTMKLSQMKILSSGQQPQHAEIPPIHIAPKKKVIKRGK